MKILVVIDEYGWAFEFFARGWKKYSRHQIDFLKWTEASCERLAYYDIVWAMSSVMFSFIAGKMKMSHEKVVCGIVSLLDHEQAPEPSCLLASVANSERAFQIAKERHPAANNIFYLRGPIDGNEWSYADVSANKRVGWAGNPGQPVKRVHLLNKIAEQYGGVARKSDWGSQVFHPGRKRDDQLAFYRSLGCYVQVSSSEGMSQALQEAFACGVPVIATPAGDTAKLVPAEWLLPMDENECVKETNLKINQLFSNQELARRVGLANRKKFEEEGWCWSKMAVEYDSFVEKRIESLAIAITPPTMIK
jgi:glycosyltransferase involved in cell wall biosynthesis